MLSISNYDKSFIFLLLLSIVVNIKADIGDEYEDLFKISLQQNYHETYQSHNILPRSIVFDQQGIVLCAVCSIVLTESRFKQNQGIHEKIDTVSNLSCQLHNGIDSFIYLDEQVVEIDNNLLQSLHDNGKQIDITSQASIPGALPLITLTNPVSVAVVVAAVATALALDHLSKMGVIHSGWSFNKLKENIFGVTIYEGDLYYKNWSNPCNLERKFPKFCADKNLLSDRIAYEQEMAAYLVTASNLVQTQEVLKQLTWPNKACEKILNFRFQIDPLYISEQEEVQLDHRLKDELANCRASIVRNIKENIAKLYTIFESLGHELVYQLKKVMESIKDFKMDQVFLALFSVVAGIQYEKDNKDAPMVLNQNYDLDVILDSMSKKEIYNVCIEGLKCYTLLDDFEKMVDNNSEFSTICSFLGQQKNQNSYHSFSEQLLVAKTLAIEKKDKISTMLEEIRRFYQIKYGSNKLTDTTKMLKKIGALYAKHRNKNMYMRLQKPTNEKFKVQDCIEFFSQFLLNNSI